MRVSATRCLCIAGPIYITCSFSGMGSSLDGLSKDLSWPFGELILTARLDDVVFSLCKVCSRCLMEELKNGLDDYVHCGVPALSMVRLGGSGWPKVHNWAPNYLLSYHKDMVW